MSRSAAFGLALLLAFAVKAFSANAGAGALAWLLAPTAALVAALTGARFEAEPAVGYLSRELALVIAPACAGLNHLVIGFSMLALGFAPRNGGPGRRLGWLLAAAALAYATTLLANAARIVLGVALPPPAWLSAEQAHRLTGVAVYLGSLWLLASTAARGSRAGAWQAALRPLLFYLGVTLGLPLANGAFHRPAFWSHALAVTAASLALLAVVLAGLSAARGLRRGAARLRPARQPAAPSSTRSIAA